MWNGLTIAKREIKRFRSRFRGGSRPLVIVILAAALIVSYLVAQSGLTLSKSFYTIGVSPDGPPIDDSRFQVLTLDRQEGQRRLFGKTIDAYVYQDRVLGRDDQRSQYAVGALEQYLERQELARITDEYDIDKAYPLRIETHYLVVNASAHEPGSPGSISTLIGPTPVPLPSVAPGTPSPAAGGGAPVPAGDGSSTDAAVRKQLEEAMNGSATRFKAEFIEDEEILVPSLMNPPVPLAQVIIAFLYVVPVFFISVFFTSSFMDEKTHRKLNILMSAPVSAFDIIAGKMLPYLAFALAVIVAVTLALGGNLPLAIAIFTPIVLFIFAIYLMVALFYRTYKDQTFFSMTAITFVTGYLVFPALFAGVNSLSYISPLTLAVQMYRGEPFGLAEYVFSTAPMYLVFALALFVGVRIFNEEYLMSYGPLYRKAGDAIYLAIDKGHMYASVTLLGLLLVPGVFMVELIILALSMNIPQVLTMIVVLMFFSAMVEEIAKSAGIAVLLEYGNVRSLKAVLALSFLSALGFLVGEKLLLYLSLGVLSNAYFLEAIASANLLVIPLLAHSVFTAIVGVTTQKLGTRYYFVAVLGGTLVHTLYNLYNLRSAGAF